MLRFRVLLAGFLLAAAGCVAQNPVPQPETSPAWKNPSLPLAQRVDDLVARLTLEEKVAQMMDQAPGIARLGVPAYSWWNEALHGVARAGDATVFPQAIGLAATWDTPLLHRVADVISTEARAKHHEAVRQGKLARYSGLTFWSPNLNIFRDPRWGRGQETYGEDPFLTARLGVEFVKGLQGDDPQYLKAIATPKHYAVHSGPESARHAFDAQVSLRDMQETYLPAFRATIVEGGAESVMCAYNSDNGQPACANDYLLKELLRGRWGFQGYVVSDCGAVWDILHGHQYVDAPEKAAALAVHAGTDLDCGDEYKSLVRAVQQGLIPEAEIDRAVKRLLAARFRLGMFDPPELVHYADIPISANDAIGHRELALDAARKSIVLLKNDNLLPLSPRIKKIAVIGPNADSLDVLLGNYNGTPSQFTTPLQGIRQRFADRQVTYALGAELTPTAGATAPKGKLSHPTLQAEAVRAARKADVVVLVLGISPRLEGEEMDVQTEGFSGGDRTSLDLPPAQERLLEAVAATRKPVVLVLLNGSALAVNWAQQHVPAILEAWYPGEEGGTAIADTLAGDNNPAGRLPATFYKSVAQLPPFTDYAMTGRTYRYFAGEPLYPFGFGLSYSAFRYTDLRIEPRATGAVIRATVENTSARPGDEVVQLYVTDLDAPTPKPIRALAGFQRVHLNAGQRMQVSFTLGPRELSRVNDQGKRIFQGGKFAVSVGGRQPDSRPSTSGYMSGEFALNANTIELD